MKICIISTGLIPSPIPKKAYGGIEAVTANSAHGLAKKGHDVTLITTNESEWIDESPHPNLKVLGFGDARWDWQSEREMYIKYKDFLEQEYGDGNSIVHDNSWWGYPYYSLQKTPNMKLLHSFHGVTNWIDYSTNPPRPVPPPLSKFPRFLGVSSPHANYISDVFHLPCRFVHNGIDLPKKPAQWVKGDYLLSLNRISPEKGIHSNIDCAISTGHKIIVVGDDINPVDQNYIWKIQDRCKEYGPDKVEYVGTVDNNQKWEYIRNCKAMISCLENHYVESFGIYAVEAGAMGKPLFGLINGGLSDIITNGRNGYLASTVEKLKTVISQNNEYNPDDCRAEAEKFSVENMVKGYEELFQKVLEGEKW